MARAIGTHATHMDSDKRQSAARRVLFIIRSQSAPTLSVHEIISRLCGCWSCVNLRRDTDRCRESKSSNMTASGNFVEQVVGLPKKSSSELTWCEDGWIYQLGVGLTQ